MRIQMLCEMSFGYKLLLQNFLQKCPKPYNLKLMSEIIMNFLQFFRENLVFFSYVVKYMFCMLAGDLQKSYFCISYPAISMQINRILLSVQQ